MSDSISRSDRDNAAQTASASSGGATFSSDPSVPAATGLPLDVPATHLPGATRGMVVPLAAAAGAALVGGLVWAWVVIDIKVDIGILAWLVGGVTGLAVARISAGRVGWPVQLGAGALAAAGIVVGKYVIFVHAVKSVLGAQIAAQGGSVGYLDGNQMSIFVHNFRHIVPVGYVVWIPLAFFAAVRSSNGGAIFRRRS
jgi:hypothetical protein